MDPKTKSCQLSVVIISKNEDGNIKGCIESILTATGNIENTEIILADSASTDKTIDIALKYPIKIVQLNPKWPLSAAAGRYIGFLHSRGEYIQFQDADTVLYKDWLEHAIPVLAEDENLAGVVGTTTQEEYSTRDARKYIERIKLYEGTNDTTEEIEWYAGNALLKRSVLEKVGAFNPYLLAGEEGELSYRIKQNGFKLLRIPYRMAHHLGYDEKFNIERETRFTKSQGQIFRYSLENKNIFKLRLIEYKFKIFSFFLTMFFIFSLGVFLLSGQLSPFYFFIIGFFIYFSWIFYETRDLLCSMRHVVTQTIKCPVFLWGFLEPKKDPSVYPTDVKIIK